MSANISLMIPGVHAEQGMLIALHSACHSPFQRQSAHVPMIGQSSISQDAYRTRLLIGVLSLVAQALTATGNYYRSFFDRHHFLWNVNNKLKVALK